MRCVGFIPTNSVLWEERGMTDRIKQCDVVNSCEDCTRYGDDCDGDKR